MRLGGVVLGMVWVGGGGRGVVRVFAGAPVCLSECVSMCVCVCLPSQTLVSVLSSKPLGHSHWKLPKVLMQFPPWHKPGSSRHSLMSAEEDHRTEMEVEGGNVNRFNIVRKLLIFIIVIFIIIIIIMSDLPG